MNADPPPGRCEILARQIRQDRRHINTLERLLRVQRMRLEELLDQGAADPEKINALDREIAATEQELEVAQAQLQVVVEEFQAASCGALPVD